MSRLVDNFGKDLGEVVEVDMIDSHDETVRAYTVYVKSTTVTEPDAGFGGQDITYEVDEDRAAELAHEAEEERQQRLHDEMIACDDGHRAW